ncbi:MAG: GtrA family protein [Candidatus Kaiserbacteria bacterium]|nr:GtrA family protein [Candidatus Kaiserbacteria bacterium]
MIDTALQLVRKHQQIFRYLIAGGLAFAVNIIVLYVLTDVLHVYYLFSTVAAFLVSFLVSFTLQKFWTFQDNSRDQLHLQLPLYLTMQVVNLGLNTALMYALVEYLHIWYILSQTIITTILAVIVYIINKKYIFKQTSEQGRRTEEIG